MFLVNIDESLNIMDAMINNEVISHTEAKKLMTKQVKPAHRDLLLDTLKHTNKEFSFSSFANDDDIHGMTKTKKVTGKMYNKSDLLLAIEEYKADNTLINQFNELIKQQEENEKDLQEQQEKAAIEEALKGVIENRANEILEQNNKEVMTGLNIESDDIFEMLMQLDNITENSMTYEEAYQQAKKELLGA